MKEHRTRADKVELRAGMVIESRETRCLYLIDSVHENNVSVVSLQLPPLTNSDRARILAENCDFTGGRTLFERHDLKWYWLCQDARLTDLVAKYRQAIRDLMYGADRYRSIRKEQTT